MKKEDIVILKNNNGYIEIEGYKSIARGLINAYGLEICKLLVEKYHSEEDKYK